MSEYERRFEVLKEFLYEPVPKPSRIYKIMSILELSQRISMELCFNLKRSQFRNYLKKELENDGYTDPYVNLMPASTWRYFKINCCIYADRYDKPNPYTRQHANKMFKPLAHIHQDLVRYLNNWYNLANFITYRRDKENFVKNKDSTEKYNGLLIDKGDVDARNGGEEDVEFLLSKADEVATVLGFSDAEALVSRLILQPNISKIKLAA